MLNVTYVGNFKFKFIPSLPLLQTHIYLTNIWLLLLSNGYETSPDTRPYFKPVSSRYDLLPVVSGHLMHNPPVTLYCTHKKSSTPHSDSIIALHSHLNSSLPTAPDLLSSSLPCSDAKAGEWCQQNSPVGSFKHPSCQCFSIENQRNQLQQEPGKQPKFYN